MRALDGMAQRCDSTGSVFGRGTSGCRGTARVARTRVAGRVGPRLSLQELTPGPPAWRSAGFGAKSDPRIVPVSRRLQKPFSGRFPLAGDSRGLACAVPRPGRIAGVTGSARPGSRGQRPSSTGEHGARCPVHVRPDPPAALVAGIRAVLDLPAQPLQVAAATILRKPAVYDGLTLESGDIPDGERKTVTALFADIKGSMELMEDLDPEEACAIVDPALRLMIDAVHRYDGYIVQFISCNPPATASSRCSAAQLPATKDHPQRALYAAPGCKEDIAPVTPSDLEPRASFARRSRSASGRTLLGETVVRSTRTRRHPHRIYPQWAFDQPGVADAGAGADRFDRYQRTHA